MRQLLHLLVVDRVRSTALTASCAGRWLLPVLTCDESARAGMAVSRWTAAQGIAGEVVGQWLGRIAPSSVDWLVVFLADPQTLPNRQDLARTPLTVLSPDTSLIEYQGWALERALNGGSLPSVPGPFGSLHWIGEVKTWIGGVTGAVRSVTPYRASPQEVVLGADTSSGRVYFKGLAAERHDEVRLTQRLAELCPQTFARTLAVASRPTAATWWLTAACSGRPNADGRSIARALANVQRRVAADELVGEMRELDLVAVASWAADLVADPTCAAAIGAGIDRAFAAAVPWSWIPMDLHPTNVLMDGGGAVRFIDLDDSFGGPAPLAIAHYAQPCPDASLYRVYEESWSPGLHGVDWPAFESTAAVVNGWLGWQRIERNTRSGQITGRLDLAAASIRARLKKAGHRL